MKIKQNWNSPKYDSDQRMDCGNRIIHWELAGGGQKEVNTQSNFKCRKEGEILYL